MAKTFIGELILRFKDESSTGAKKSAAEISGSLGKIEAAAKRLNEMPWGGKFTQQLDKLGASSKDLVKLKQAWDRLYTDISERNLSKALQKSELGNWRNATLQHFVQQQQAMRDEFKKTEASAKSWKNSIANMTKAGLVTAGAYTGAYMGGVALRSGIEASADWEREKFRLAQSGYSSADQAAAIKNSQAITTKYPQISGTQALELTKSAIAATGGTEEGLSIAQLLARAQAVFQSQGKDADIGGEMAKFTKGGELAGLIKPGPGGQERFKTALDNWIKFSQIEGQYMSMGDFFSMTRRAKGAFAGADDSFISLLPLLGVEMTAAGAGTAFSSLNKSYLSNTGTGSGKANREEQERIGIRDENGLVGRSEFQANPATWTLKYMIPALVKAGINIDDKGDVQAEMAKLIGNANSQNMQAILINQRANIAKGIAQQQGAVGLDAADDARYKDPFSGWMAFMNSMKNLAAAVGEGPMDTAIAGLNKLTDGINRLQSTWRNGGALGKTEVGAGLGVGAFGAWKALSGVYALATAGPALNASAVALNGAAAALTEAAGVGAISKGGPAAKGWLGWGASMLGSWGAVLGLGALQSGSAGPVTAQQRAAQLLGDGGEWLKTHPFIPERPGPNAGRGFLDPMRYGINALQGAVDSAHSLDKVLSTPTRINVDTSGIDEANAKAHQLMTTLGVAVGYARQATNFDLPSTTGAGSVSREMNRSFSDHGIVP